MNIRVNKYETILLQNTVPFTGVLNYYWFATVKFGFLPRMYTNGINFIIYETNIALLN